MEIKHHEFDPSIKFFILGGVIILKFRMYLSFPFGFCIKMCHIELQDAFAFPYSVCKERAMLTQYYSSIGSR